MMAVLISFCLSVALLARTSSSLSCFDETCNPPMICKVEFSHGYPRGGSCDQQHQHGHHPICGNSFPDHGHCHCDEQSCMSRVYTLTTPSLVPVTTAVPIVPTVTTSTTQAPVVTSCVDNEDTTFNCKTYQDNYAMCQATSGTLKTIASNRCQKYCGLCGSNTAPPAPSTTASTAQTTCIDHEVKCSDQAYIDIICSSSHQATKDYAIAICPKSCNLCTEHFASINPGFGLFDFFETRQGYRLNITRSDTINRQLIKTNTMGSVATKYNENEQVASVFLAIRTKKFKRAMDLFSKGNFINCIDFEGHTPLIEACRGDRHSESEMEREQFVTFLLQNGSNISKPDVYGWTAAMYADENHHYSIARKLNSIEGKISCYKKRADSLFNFVQNEDDEIIEEEPVSVLIR